PLSALLPGSGLVGNGRFSDVGVPPFFVVTVDSGPVASTGLDGLSVASVDFFFVEEAASSSVDADFFFLVAASAFASGKKNSAAQRSAASKLGKRCISQAASSSSNARFKRMPAKKFS